MPKPPDPVLVRFPVTDFHKRGNYGPAENRFHRGEGEWGYLYDVGEKMQRVQATRFSERQRTICKWQEGCLPKEHATRRKGTGRGGGDTVASSVPPGSIILSSMAPSGEKRESQRTDNDEGDRSPNDDSIPTL